MLLDKKPRIFKMNRLVSLQDLNPHLMCVLCGGYYVDATTIIECVHSFCRSCIVKHLASSKYCPICEVMVHKTKPLMNIRRDKTLQDIVYKLVPGLFAREMQERRQFYMDRPHYVKPDDVESGGEVSDERKSYICDDSITVSLTDHASEYRSWFLRCPVSVKIEHLKKLILAKYGFKCSKVHVAVMLNNQILDDDLTLIDISCLYPWRSKDSLELTYAMLGVNEKRTENSEELKSLDEDKATLETEKLTGEVVEKEIQLQITESGVMSVSEIDSRQGNNSLNQILACSLPEADAPITNPSNEPNSTPVTLAVPSDSGDDKKERQKRPSTESERAGIKPKRPSISREETSSRKREDKKDAAKNIVQPTANKDVPILDSSKESVETSKVVSVNAKKLSAEEKQDAAIEKNVSDGGRNSVPPDKDATRGVGTPDKPANQEGAGSNTKPSANVSQPGPPVPMESKPNKHKAIRTTPHPWRPVITKEKLRPTLMTNSEEPRKPGKFFKMRNMPRFLGNPASGVKPLYSNGLPPASPPRKVEPIVRIDPKTLRPIQKEEKKAPNTLLTNPFIPRDNHFMLPDPKTQPYSKINYPPGFHASLPPSISMLLNPHQHFRNLKAREEAAAKLCDSPGPRPSASVSKPAETEPAQTSVAASEPPSKCV